MGHCDPRIVAAIADQAATLGGTSSLFYSAPALRLSERLVNSSLGDRAFLCNSGAEANECAIKLARRHAHARGIAGERTAAVMIEPIQGESGVHPVPGEVLTAARERRSPADW